jgi:nitroreductase
MNLLDALSWRYATKRMTGETIPEEKLNTILEAIRLAPSSFGLTPYKIIVIEDLETRKKLQPHFYNQPQIAECSALVIFAAYTHANESDVDTYMQEIAAQRGIPVEALKDFEGYIKGAIAQKSQEALQTWAEKQTYIALGVGLVAAAAEKVDATPMEGFNPAGVDEVLDLPAQGLHAAVALALGYRDAANDYLVAAKKVRRAAEVLMIRK